MAVRKRIPGPGADNAALGRAIAEQRTAKGLTQFELARRSNIDPQHLSKIERGVVSPKFATMQAIAKALGVNVEALSGASVKPRRRHSFPPSAA